MQQYQAGFILDCVGETLRNPQFEAFRVQGLLKYLSCFDLIANFDLKKSTDNPLLASLNNIITRGIPTKPTYSIEKRFMTAFGRTELDALTSKTQLIIESTSNTKLYLETKIATESVSINNKIDNTMRSIIGQYEVKTESILTEIPILKTESKKISERQNKHDRELSLIKRMSYFTLICLICILAIVIISSKYF